MGYIRLNPKDAARYGVAERVEFDLETIGLRQRIAFEKSATGPRRSYRWLLDQLSGVPALDDAGNPIPVPLLDEAGNPVLGADGQPEMTPKLTRDLESVVMLVWLVLWGAGVRTPWETFDILEHGFDLSFADDDEDAGDGQGKDDPTASESTTTTP